MGWGSSPSARDRRAPPSGGLSRTLVGKADVSVPGREAVVAKVEVAPGEKLGAVATLRFTAASA